jgi:hypothetical protein
MLRAFTTAAWVLLPAILLAQASQEKVATNRYGIELRPKKYSQQTPKGTLASVLAVIEAHDIAYLMAHLADPDFVDKRVGENHQGRFDGLVAETKIKIEDNPSSVKELEQFLRAGEWQESGTAASVRLKDLKDRQVFFRKIGDRWFMQNKQKEEK